MFFAIHSSWRGTPMATSRMSGRKCANPVEDHRLLLGAEIAVMDHHEACWRAKAAKLRGGGLGVGALGAEQPDGERPRLGRAAAPG